MRLLLQGILFIAVMAPIGAVAAEAPQDATGPGVAVEIIEDCKDRDWASATAAPSQEFSEPAMAFVRLPRKYSERGVIADRSAVFLLRARCQRTLPAGEYQLMLRAVSGSRLLVDDVVVASTEF